MDIETRCDLSGSTFDGDPGSMVVSVSTAIVRAFRALRTTRSTSARVSTVLCRLGDLWRFDSTSGFLGERMKLQLDIQLCQSCVVRRGNPQCVEIEFDR